MKTMKAVVKYDSAPGATEVREVAVPDIGPSDVLVKVAYTGICGTDPHIHLNKVSFKTAVPLILGHEFAGIVEITGKDVNGFSAGDRVTAETHADYCGECMLCHTNRYHLCRHRNGYGFHTHGAFAQYIRVPAGILHRLPKGVGMKEASLIEPLCVAYKAVAVNSSVKPGDTVVVIGPGPIGILCSAVAKISGAGRILVIGTRGDDRRLETALRYGATEVINSSREDPLPVIMSIGDKYGADLVVDTAGSSSTLRLSMDAVRPEGQITKVGWGPEPVGFTLDPIIAKSITLKGHFSHTWDVWEKCLTLLERGQIDLAPLITHELPLSKWEEGFELVEAKQAMKAVLIPEN